LHYLKDEATSAIPIWRMIATPAGEIRRRAQRWQRALGPRASVIQGESTIGGGSLPGETMPTWLVALEPDASSSGAEGLAARLRCASPPIVARIEGERVLLDPRTVSPEEEKSLVRVVGEAVGGK
ncbi:MAG: L-seryl-tRNA(Sec) selenium transferase, partial [Dehalococcoidia bacterium]